jgi:anti-sigma-K factor RskA
MAERTTMTCDEFRDWAAVVALDSGEPDDMRLFEEHAQTCPDCARQLDEFNAVTAALGAAVPQVDPPSALRARLFEAVRHTEQQAPDDLSVQRQRGFWRRRVSPAWLVAAASLVLSLAAIGAVAVLQGQVVALRGELQIAEERAGRYVRVVRVLSSDTLAVRSLQPVAQSTQTRGTVYMDPSSGTGMVMCRNLPRVERGRGYQVWFVRGNERVSGGMLRPDPNGNGYTLIQLPADLESFDSIGLTEEPGGGSPMPTTPRVIGTPLKESQ